MCFPEIRSSRPAVRHSHRTVGGMQPEGEYGAIIDRLGAIADREHKTAGGYIQLGEFTACALRGFCLLKTVMGGGTYGPELEQCLRRQARSERDRLWRDKIRFLITNRISRADSAGRFGVFDGEGSGEVSITLPDCFALDAVKYKGCTWDGTKLEGKKSEPHTASCFVTSAKQQIKLFFLLYGD